MKVEEVIPTAEKLVKAHNVLNYQLDKADNEQKRKMILADAIYQILLEH